MKKIYVLYLAAFIIRASFGQGGNAPVRWSYKTEAASDNEITLSITARVAPGWHIYSQHIKEDGPQPTRITFQKNDSYSFVGRTREIGNKTRLYDEAYGMHIVWYAGTASFQQRIRLHEPVTTIRGTIEYMVCNNEMCIPDKQKFSVDVDLLKQSQNNE